MAASEENGNEDPQAFLRAELDAIHKADLYRQLRTRESPHVGGMVQIDNKQYISFCSNDYLGLSGDSRLVDAVKQAAGYVGCGSAASPLISGRGAIHARLEKELAKFERTEASLLFTTGFAANCGTIGAIANRESVIFSDEHNHASIIDGCRLSRAKIEIYRHNDMEHLQSLLSATDSATRKLIVTDSLFSMNGDFAPLDRLANLARDHRAMLMVDEAHATGVFGSDGRGLCELFGVEGDVHVRVGTLSKALGSFGGFVSGSHDLIELILNHARPYIFSTAAPESIANASLAALDIVKNEPERRESLLKLCDHVREQLQGRLSQSGVPIGNDRSQIVPVIVGSNSTAIELSEKLKQDGFLVPAIRPPTVPENQAMLRISLTASHSREQIDSLVDKISKHFKTIDSIVDHETSQP